MTFRSHSCPPTLIIVRTAGDPIKLIPDVRSVFAEADPLEGGLVTVLGLTIGLEGDFGATRMIASQLFGVTPMDPITILAIAIVLVAIALLACYIPARLRDASGSVVGSTNESDHL